MTAGEQLIEQGRQLGIQQGFEQGFEQGRRQGVQDLWLRLLRQRFGKEADVQVEQRVAAASLEQLVRWAERVVSAATLAELFRIDEIGSEAKDANAVS
jgi:flagellar biosynthesis/type III secretory pathway protein FliH